jgi:hypothetical protein
VQRRGRAADTALRVTGVAAHHHTVTQHGASRGGVHGVITHHRATALRKYQRSSSTTRSENGARRNTSRAEGPANDCHTWRHRLEAASRSPARPPCERESMPSMRTDRARRESTTITLGVIVCYRPSSQTTDTSDGATAVHHAHVNVVAGSSWVAATLPSGRNTPPTHIRHSQLPGSSVRHFTP